MEAYLEAVEYKAMAGFYVRLFNEDGSSQALDDWSTSEPLFPTKAEAEDWIETCGVFWLDVMQAKSFA